MKKIAFLVLIITSFMFSSCVKDAAEEGVAPDCIPHFNYGGYTYYVHPSLGKTNWKDANRACRKLKAYGYDDWFLPSMSELDAAVKSYTIKECDMWSSTEYSTKNYYAYIRYVNNDYYSGAGFKYGWNGAGDDWSLDVIPMRKQAAASGY